MYGVLLLSSGMMAVSTGFKCHCQTQIWPIIIIEIIVDERLSRSATNNLNLMRLCNYAECVTVSTEAILGRSRISKRGMLRCIWEKGERVI